MSFLTMIAVLGLAQAEALPACPSYFPRDESFDCSVDLGEGERLDVLGEQSVRTAIHVRASGESRPLEFPEEQQEFNGVRRVDLNLDGTEEVLLSEFYGIPNGNEIVYQRGADGWLVVAGITDGVGLRPASEPGGLLDNWANVSAARKLRAFLTLDEAGLRQVYELDINFQWMRCDFEPGPAFDEFEIDASAEIEACEAEIPNPDPYIDLPACDDPAAEQRLFDCRLEVPAMNPIPRSYLRASTGEGTVSLTQHMIDGALMIELGTFETGRGSGQIRLEDINEDGTPELVVPLFTGNVNTAYALFAHRQRYGGYQFAGEFGGLGFDYDPETGLVEVSGRVNAASHYKEAYSFEGGQFENVYTLETNLAEETCVVTEGPGFAASGLDRDQLQDRCAADAAEGGQ